MVSPIKSEMLNLGAFFHLSLYKKLLHNFITKKFRKIYLANDEYPNIVKK